MSATEQSRPESPKSPILPAVVGAVILFGAAAFIGWGVWKAMNPAPVPLQGMIDATTVSVAAKVPGRLAAIHVREGDVVKTADAVARLALPEIEAKVAQARAAEAAAVARVSLADEGPRTQELDAARADLTRARAGLALAEASWRRVSTLHGEGLVSSQRRDEVLAQKRSAEELVRAAGAKVAALEDGARRQDKEAARALAAQAAGGVAEASSLASESEVRSPASGEVTRIVMHEGEVVPAGFPIVLVTNLADSWAVFNVREDELANLRVGTELMARVPALGRDVRLRVYWINPRGDYAVWRATRQSSGYDLRTFEVRARPAEPVPDLRPGMTVIVDRSALAGA